VSSSKLTITILVGILFSTIGLGGYAVTQLTAVRTEFAYVTDGMDKISSDMGKFADKLSVLAEKDILDLRERLTRLEGKDILPRAERQFVEVEVRDKRQDDRIRELERYLDARGGSP